MKTLNADNVAQAYLAAGVVARRNGNEHPSVVPSQSFQCQDGMIMLAAGNDGQFAKLCAVIGEHDLVRDMRQEYVGYENNLKLVEDLARDPESLLGYLPERALRAFQLYRKHFRGG